MWPQRPGRGTSFVKNYCLSVLNEATFCSFSAAVELPLPVGNAGRRAAAAREGGWASAAAWAMGSFATCSRMTGESQLSR